jgi:uncharacterized protein YcbK (DUF882 family)
MGVSRRCFVGSLAAAGAAFAGLPRRLGAAPASRTLSLLHTHTGERLEVAYFAGGGYVDDALAAVNHLLRDWRTEDVFPIEPGLLDLLHRLNAATAVDAPFQVISGYRSPATNAMLRTRSRGVAASSLHMKGMAIDIRVPGVPLRTVWRSALRLQGGGVGFYPASNFVHVDIGRVRRW